MLEIMNIGSEAYQEHIISYGEFDIILGLRFYPTVEMWCMDVEYVGVKTRGVKLSLGVLHLENRNYPFDIIIKDRSGLGIDPFKIDDFKSKRIMIAILEPQEIAEIRGYDVEIL